MGIGSAIKDALRSDSRTSSHDTSRLPAGSGPSTTDKLVTDKPYSATNNSTVAAEAGVANGGFKDTSSQRITGGNYNLPSGTGPGTTGVPDTGKEKGVTTSALKKKTSDSEDTTSRNIADTNHRVGHLDASSKYVMPSGHTTEDRLQLNPVTHEHVRHIETEEVQRMKERDRHIHHVQHHLQPVVASVEKEEKHHENVHPTTHIRENHVNKLKDSEMFNGQIREHHDTVHHGAKERIVIDKGTILNENIHHHVHHVIQPIIEKETLDKHRIHTTIPIHEVTHEAPVVHQSQSHAPISFDQYLGHGGVLAGASQPEDAGARLLKNGQCVRSVDGVAERLEKELNLSKTINAPVLAKQASE